MARPIRILFSVIVYLALLRLTECQFVNNFQEDFTFQCPSQQAITGIFSRFSLTDTDRRWSYSCGSSGGLVNVSSTCSLQAAINALSGSINDFQCPNNGYLSGFDSTYSSSQRDRVWRPYCCDRPHAALVDCVSQNLWQNELRRDLNITLPSPELFLVGIESFFDVLVDDRRWRYTYCGIEVSCGDPGVPAHGSRQGNEFLFGDVVMYSCEDGYFMSEGSEERICQSTGLWSGTLPVCTACTDIAHCADIRCTNATDQTCVLCDSDHGLGYGRRGFENLGDACEPLCSWLASYCYPGNCSGHISTCECEDGFAGPHCLNMTTSVDSFTCSVEISSNGTTLVGSCTNTTSVGVFINFIPLALNVMWTTTYRGLGALPRMPAYFVDLRLGVVNTYITVDISRASNPSKVALSSRYECASHNLSRDSPLAVVMCNTAAVLSDISSSVFHGDHFTVKVTAENGGFLDLLNLDTNSNFREYYSGIAYTGVSGYVVDLLPPVHCSLHHSVICLADQPILDLHTSFLQEITDLRVTWGGYTDTPSGVEHYELRVYLMLEMGGVLQEHPRDVVAHLLYDHNNAQFYSNTTSLPMDGPYSIILQVHDIAGNIRYVRRLVLYDTNSSLEVDQTHPLAVVNAVPPSLEWVNTTEGPLTIHGRSHFYNTNLRDSNWLAPVADYMYGEVEPDYDHPLTTGSYPRNGTRNAQGVVGLEYSVETNLDGPAGVTQPRSGWMPTDDIYIGAVNVEVTRVDGMSVGVWFRATDFKGNTLVDVVVVHVDSSPPVAENIWIEYAGVGGLSLHGSRLFSDLVVYLEASDTHSGLHSIAWALGTTRGGSQNGQGHLQLVQYNKTTCVPPECQCDPFGHCHMTSHRFSPMESDLLSTATQHDTDYYITVTVTNNAMLTTVLHHRFTVDVTPPLEGVVFDGPEGGYDIDYQNDLSLTFWWMGFFDRETDIVFYKYIIDEQCANSSQFQSDEQVVTTTNTSVNWLASGPGTLVITVVAFNGAYRSSAPVCSDGITVDLQPPTISSITLPDLYVHPQGGHFVPSANFLNVSWTAHDDTGFWDYLVAIATERNLLPSYADIVPPTSTGRLPFITVYNTSLSTGTRVFVFVQAVDLAGNNATRTLGPVVMDTTPPVVEGDLVVNQMPNHMIVTWSDVNITDSEEGEDVLTYHFSVGTSPYGSQVIPFSTNISNFPCESTTCVAIDSSQLLSNNFYYITLAVTNVVGLKSFLTKQFHYVTGGLSPGVVMETLSALDYQDIDVTTTDVIFAKWFGLQHSFLPVIYSVAMGTIPGGSDVSGFIDVGGATSYEFNNVTFETGRTYFVTVVGEYPTGNGTAISDGFLYLGNLTQEYLMGEANISVDQQLSTSVVMATWTFPPNLLPHLSHYLVGVHSSGDSLVSSLVNTARCTSVGFTDLKLEPSQAYTVSVTFCHVSGCLPAVYSEYFFVTTPPDILSIEGSYSIASSVLSVSWSVSTSSDVVEYQWTLGLDSTGGSLLLPWQSLDGSHSGDSFSDPPIDGQVDVFLTVKAYSSDNLLSSKTVPIRYQLPGGGLVDRENTGIPPPDILDVLPDSLTAVPAALRWEDQDHIVSDLVDVDHTALTNQIAAVWPSLRYKVYHWSVSMQPNFLPCDQAISCGQTHSNFVIVGSLELKHKHTYYTCVKGFPRDLIEVDVLPVVERAVEVCTDGITVLSVPPPPGVVYVTPTGVSQHVTQCQTDKVIQTSLSEVNLTWEGFTGGFIANYEYAIGTVPKAVDIVPFTSVGVSVEAFVRGLRLLPGVPYYVTVKATDYVGQFSTTESDPVIIDTTPPTISRIWAESEHAHTITSPEHISIHWKPPVEEESCVKDISVSLGSHPGRSSSGLWTKVEDIGSTSTSLTLNNFSVKDGDILYVNVKVSNVLGLVGVYTSDLGYLYDSSPPVGEGVVYDGLGDNDEDFTPSDSTISAHWLPYHDPHTTVHYHWAIGTCPRCRDVQEFTSVGRSLRATAQGLSLPHGTTYYTSVRACNTAGLCHCCGYSDGITIDLTPPTVGVVFDGINLSSVTHQADRAHKYSSWRGFHDLESGLSHYIYSAGYFPGDTSLVPPTLLPVIQTSIITPTNISDRDVFFTITAVNNAGTSTTVHSGGVSMDDTHPFLSPPLVDVHWAGSNVNHSQYTNSVVRLMWNVTTPTKDTPTVYWTLIPEKYARPLPVKYIYSFSGVKAYLQLSDGDKYTAFVTACTVHGLCTRSSSDEVVLVDSSPPIDGYFAVDTESSANLSRSVPWGMTWRNLNGRGWLTLAWTGFSDPHSGVSGVMVTVGSQYNTEDLSGGPQLIGVGSEGVASIGLTSPLQRNSTVYIVMWAVNGVGLPSAKVVGSFLVYRDPVSTNKTLILLRSVDCVPQTCMGHCTCGPRGERCNVNTSLLITCSNVTSLRSGELGVSSSFPQPLLWPTNVTYNIRRDKLEAFWNYTGNDVRWVEWTVISTHQVPSVWYLGDSLNAAIYTPTHSLVHGGVYQILVRAWYSNMEYAVFTSAPITVDLIGPSVVKGRRVVEGTSQDVDYVSSEEVGVAWTGVFLPEQKLNYQIRVGTSPGGSGDIANVLEPTEDHRTITIRNVYAGRLYLTTVSAMNALGLSIHSVSDGFLYDNRTTIVGHVFYKVTEGVKLNLWWTGFHGYTTPIEYYRYAVQESLTPPTDSDFLPVGLSLSHVHPTPLLHGVNYTIHVQAVDVIGTSSMTAVAIVTGDETPPEGVSCTFDSNVVDNPSFEGTFLSKCLSDGGSLDGWRVGPSVTIATIHTTVPADGCYSALVKSHISQTITTQTGSTYRFSFAVRAPPTGYGWQPATGSVEIDGRSVWLLTATNQWSYVLFEFTAETPSTNITIRSHSNYGYGFLIDDVSIATCSDPNSLNDTGFRVTWPRVFRPSRRYLSQLKMVHLCWNVQDNESGIASQAWAVGNSPGGTQHHHFQPTTGSCGALGPLHLSHGSHLHATLRLTNGAGLTRIIQSDPFIVDFTSPMFPNGVIDGAGPDDMDYTLDPVFQVTWSGVVDGESGVSHCYTGLGSSRGLYDIEPLSITSGHSHTWDTTNMTHSVFYTVVMCVNGAGLVAMATSDGITVIPPPSLSDAMLVLDTPTSSTFYASKQGYFPTDDVTAVWTGRSNTSPLSFQMRIRNGSTDWVDVGQLQQLTLFDLNLPEFTENYFEVRPVGPASQVASALLYASFNISTEQPSITGSPILAMWNTSEESLTIDWTDKFYSSTSLRYEVSIVNAMGSAPVTAWYETEMTVLVFNARRLSPSQDYIVTITAITQAGYPITYHHLVHASV